MHGSPLDSAKPHPASQLSEPGGHCEVAAPNAPAGCKRTCLGLRSVHCQFSSAIWCSTISTQVSQILGCSIQWGIASTKATHDSAAPMYHDNCSGVQYSGCLVPTAASGQNGLGIRHAHFEMLCTMMMQARARCTSWDKMVASHEGCSKAFCSCELVRLVASLEGLDKV